jgi:hypothetical protein
VLDPIEEGHGIGPADRLTHFAGFDDVTLEQSSEMNLSLFAPAGAGRRYRKRELFLRQRATGEGR